MKDKDKASEISESLKQYAQYKKGKSRGRFAFILFLSALIVAAGIGYSGIEIGKGLASRNGNAITVTGSAKTSATADNVVWQLTSNETALDAAGAVKKIDFDSNALTQYLTQGGIASTAISYGSVSTYPNDFFNNGNDTGRVLNYRANQNITVRSSDVNLINKLSNGIGKLLQTGVNINNSGPQYYVSTLASLRPQLLSEAMADAKVRAIAITKAVGGKVGSVISVTSGPVQVTAPDSTDTSAGGIYDTSSIPKTVTVTVSVSFATH
jgi:hypothetical protein